MSVLRMVVKEIWHRKINFLLAVLAVAVAAAFVVAFLTAARASERETARVMLTMGYNLHVIARQASVDGFLLTGVADKTMPQTYLDTLASQQSISYNHLLATLDGRMSLRGTEILLTGVSPEVCPPGQKMQPMTFQIQPGTAYVGYRVAETLGIQKGDTVTLNGKELKVERCLAESGGADDMRVQCDLSDAQVILGLPGQISEIKAVDCLCYMKGDPVAILRKEIGSILPDVQVFQARPLATARAKQRQMIQNLYAMMVPFVLAACGIWIAVMAVTNVRDRRQEVGLLRALGYDTGSILRLFLCKAVLVGLFGGAVGFWLGTGLGLRFGPRVFEITAKTMLRPELSLLVFSCLLAPLFAVVASLVPAVIAVTYDPATTLREQ